MENDRLNRCSQPGLYFLDSARFVQCVRNSSMASAPAAAASVADCKGCLATYRLMASAQKEGAGRDELPVATGPCC